MQVLLRQIKIYADKKIVVLPSNSREFLRSVRLRERLRTHKVFTKDQCSYLNYHKLSIKSYVFDVY